MSAEKGLQQFGQKGVDVLMKELRQLIYQKVMTHVMQAPSLRMRRKAL